HQARHLVLGQANLLAAELGQGEVRDLEVEPGGCRGGSGRAHAEVRLIGRRLEEAKATEGCAGYGARMDEGLVVSDELLRPLDEVRLRAGRWSGPGGQHANVTASRIEAVFDVEASEALTQAQRDLLLRQLGPRVTAVAQDARSQARNRELALERLREKLAD